MKLDPQKIASAPASNDVEIEARGVNLDEVRRRWAVGLPPNDPALDWILHSPDGLFCHRVKQITGVSPVATPQERADFANGLLQEALQFVTDVRKTVGKRTVTLDECLRVHAKGSDAFWKWNRPTYKEALKICIEWQTENGFDIK
jgi:hypothetical protein